VKLQRSADGGSFRTLMGMTTTSRGRFSFSTSLPYGASKVSYRVVSPKQPGSRTTYVTPSRAVNVTAEPPPPEPDLPGRITRVTDGIGGSSGAAISGNGSSVSFTTSSPLTPDDANGVTDAFVWTRGTGSLVRMQLGGAWSEDAPALSGDGGYVSYGSLGKRVYVGQPATGTATAITSVGSARDPSISSDGSHVAYAASGMPEDTNGFGDIYVWDRGTGQSEQIVNAGAFSSEPAISGDGGVVAFSSSAGDVVSGETDSNNESDVYVWAGGHGTTRVSTGDGGAGAPAISSDGRYVAYVANTGATAAGPYDVFVWDRTTGDTTQVTHGNNTSGAPDLSADGRYLTFSSGASNLVPDDTNDNDDVFIWDLTTGTTMRITDGQGFGGASYRPAISDDGRFVAFDSGDSFGTGDTHGVGQVFLWDRLG
jgi:Tol biopolymer transport system component